MRVILKKDIPNLGRSGDIKEVKDGYARNYLLPNDLVMSAAATTAKQQAFLKQVQERKIAKRKKTAQEMAQALHQKEIRVTVKTGDDGRLFGSVTNIHVQKALEVENIILDKKVIQIDEPIKQLGKYDIVLKLYEGIQTSISLFVQDENGNIEIVVTDEESVEEPQAEDTLEEASSQADTSSENAEEAAKTAQETENNSTAAAPSAE